MTKKDIAAKMQEKTGIPAIKSAQVLDDVLDIMKEALSRGDEIKIARFGRFTVKSRRARPGRNPKTGDALTIPDHTVLTFTPSKLLKQRL
jgi:nucleoid DNA-binding protein